MSETRRYAILTLVPLDHREGAEGQPATDQNTWTAAETNIGLTIRGDIPL